MDTFTFKFSDMKKWFDDNLSDTALFATDENVHVWNMSKYDKDRSRSAFLLDRISKIRLIKPISEKYAKMYEQGVYIICDYKPNWLVFVYPLYKSNQKGGVFPYMFADHYSVPYNKNAKNQISFHNTIYLPETLGENKDGMIGRTFHDPDHFRDGVELKETGYDDSILKKRFNGIVRESILDMIKFYKNHDEYKYGSGKKKVAKQIKTQHIVVPPIRKNTQKKKSHEEQLDQQWTRNKIDHIMVFAIRRDNKYAITCFIYDHEKRAQNETSLGFFFTLDHLNSRTIRNRIIDHILGIAI